MNNLNKGIDCIGVCVVYFCHDGNGRVVLAKRSVNTRDEHGRWDIGAGSVELHESVKETLRREIREEYCTEVLETEFLGYRDLHRAHEGVATHWVALDFAVRVNAATVAIGEPEKFDDLGWFTLNTLPQPLHSQLSHFLDIHKEQLKKYTIAHS